MKKYAASILITLLLILTVIYSTPISSSKMSGREMSQIDGEMSWKCRIKLIGFGLAIGGSVIAIITSGGSLAPALMTYLGGYALAALDFIENCIDQLMAR